MALLEKKGKSKENTTAIATVIDDSRAESIDVSLSFEKQVSRFKSDIVANRKRGIKTIWEMGAFVCILKEKNSYGDKTVESFVEAMDDATVSSKEVYKWAQFAERYDLDQVNKLLSLNHIGWGVVSNLIRVKDEEARRMLEEKIDAGELAPGKVQEVVSNLNADLNSSNTETPTSNTKPTASQVNPCTAGFNKINILLESLLTNTDTCAKDIQDLSAILSDEKRHEKAIDGMQLFLSKLPDVRKSLDDIEKRLGETI